MHLTPHAAGTHAKAAQGRTPPEAAETGKPHSKRGEARGGGGGRSQQETKGRQRIARSSGGDGRVCRAASRQQPERPEPGEQTCKEEWRRLELHINVRRAQQGSKLEGCQPWGLGALVLAPAAFRANDTGTASGMSQQEKTLLLG